MDDGLFRFIIQERKTEAVVENFKIFQGGGIRFWGYRRKFLEFVHELKNSKTLGYLIQDAL